MVRAMEKRPTGRMRVGHLLPIVVRGSDAQCSWSARVLLDSFGVEERSVLAVHILDMLGEPILKEIQDLSGEEELALFMLLFEFQDLADEFGVLFFLAASVWISKGVHFLLFVFEVRLGVVCEFAEHFADDLISLSVFDRIVQSVDEFEESLMLMVELRNGYAIAVIPVDK